MKQKRWLKSVIAVSAEIAKSPVLALPWARQVRADRNKNGAPRVKPLARSANRGA